MSLQLITGESGSGKSTYLYHYVVDSAKKNPTQKYFVIVPDQFTMQTQYDLVEMTECKGIMNIDVLSFSRLAHRVFEETGGNSLPILDDTGKNLIVRKCAADVRSQVPFLGGKLDKPGYIHEVKSAISEFMQYGIDDASLERLIKYARDGRKKTLEYKLEDLRVLYAAFLQYTDSRFITMEESMDILAREIYKSKLLKDAVVVFDGFTGFTPIQNNALISLMNVCRDVWITLCMGDGELYTLTTHTYESLKRIATDNDIEIKPDIVCDTCHRYANNAELAALEKALYKYRTLSYGGVCENIRLSKCINIRTEVHRLISEIRELTANGAYYRDIAVIAGDLDTYRSELIKQFKEAEIPAFIDETSKIVLNPFIEFIKSALNIFDEDFSFNAVFQYLRTGLSDISFEEIDILEEYVRETGIRGRSMYEKRFNKTTASMRKRLKSEETKTMVVEELEILDGIRIKLLAGLKPFIDCKVTRTCQKKAAEFTEALYNFLVLNGVTDKLGAMEENFRCSGDDVLCKEYSQVYGKTIALLDQIYELVGDEVMSLREYRGILEAGFDEIKIGAIPRSVDRIIVGDLERTRLKDIKYLFFIGLNDCWVPKTAGTGGIISDMEREFLTESGEELAPSPRQKMYIGRFYLYTTFTKPSKRLYLSYTAMGTAGEGIRESSVVTDIRAIFPMLECKVYAENGTGEIESIHDARRAFAEYARCFADGTLGRGEREMLLRLGNIITDEDYKEMILCNAFKRYSGLTLDARVAGLLYGETMLTSISRIEKYASCAYSYFLQYGIGLEERMEYGTSAADVGTIYHGVLEIFIEKLGEKGLDWFTFTEEEAMPIVNEAVEEAATHYTDAIFFETYKNRYVLERIKKVMLRTVMTVSYQLRKGEFRPVGYEVSFNRVASLNCLNLALDREEKLRLSGKIDRLDTYETEDKIYVKVVDYKSGKKDFSLAAFYHGVQLQMVVYMNEAIRTLASQSEGKEIVPAAMLYYHIDDPLVDRLSTDSDEDINKKILKELRTKGIVNEDNTVVDMLDTQFESSSDVIPIKRTKSGFDSHSGVLKEEDMKLLSRYAEKKLLDIGKEIISGKIDLNPIVVKKSSTAVNTDACKYCAYKNVCGFDEHMPGYEKREYVGEDDSTLIGMMRNELEVTGDV